LTLIVPRRAGVAQAAAGGHDSIGLRCPAHPLAQAVLEAAWALGVRGVAAPSANLFGRVSPTCVAHVREELGPDLRVIDGGPCAVGIESTLIDCTRGQPVLLRPGSISRADIQAACGVPVLDAQQAAEVASLSQAPRASGTLASHYAPVARVHLLPWDALQKVVRGLPTPNVAVYSRSALVVAESEVSLLVSGSGSGALPGVVCRPMPESPQAAAHELFAVLRELDAMGVSDIYVQNPPANPEWDGVRDRLTRASA
jgi:L-threonylcarbamoyladenylate synthase